MSTQKYGRVGRTIRDIVINGIVQEINEEDETVVILDIQGSEDRRIMSTQKLKKAGITREEQGFEIHARKYEVNEELKKEYCICSLDDSHSYEAIELVPNIDFSEFRRQTVKL